MGASLVKLGQYSLPRGKAYVAAVAVGLASGVANSYLDLDFSFRPELFAWLAASVVVTVALHEAVHGAAAALLGHRPIFGFKPPLIYITFKDKLPRGHYIAVALAPLVVLDLLFGVMFASGVLRLMSDLCFIINTLGAAGDVWVVARLLGMQRGTMIQDTRDGFEVWRKE
jgi:hypothetical protein